MIYTSIKFLFTSNVQLSILSEIQKQEEYSKVVTAPKVVLAHTPAKVHQEQSNSGGVGDMEEYNETVQTLADLISGARPPASKDVHRLLDMTR